MPGDYVLPLLVLDSGIGPRLNCHRRRCDVRPVYLINRLVNSTIHATRLSTYVIAGNFVCVTLSFGMYVMWVRCSIGTGDGYGM